MYPGGRPICASCCLEMRAQKTGETIRDPEVGPFPSTYWMADRWRCELCGAEVIVGRGRGFVPDEGQSWPLSADLRHATTFYYHPDDAPGSRTGPALSSLTRCLLDLVRLFLRAGEGVEEITVGEERWNRWMLVGAINSHLRRYERSERRPTTNEVPLDTKETAPA